MNTTKTVYAILQECSMNLSGTFTQRDILLWVRRHYPDVRESTLRAHVQALTSNATNRERNHPLLGSRPPFFDRVSHGVYRVHHGSSGEAPRQVPANTSPTPPTPYGRKRESAHDQVDQMAPSAADIILVGCVKSKRTSAAAAKDLYTSALFTRERAYAERSGVPWYILSAEYGLVGPEEWIEPYDSYLPETAPSYRRAWGSQVIEQLVNREGPLQGKIFEVHAGAAYIQAIRSGLTELGASVTEPLHGLRMGERLAWYGTDRSHGASGPFTSTVDATEVQRMVEALRDVASALSPSEFLVTRGAGVRVPGLYSWWIDPDGASDLGRGLGLQFSPGLIYAGLAGATHWPSGKRSTNTLWLRIQSMHLGRKARFSTFRLTLGSILAATVGVDQIDETALTAWMHVHLRVVTAPFVDADVLGVVETEVLQSLDPPLNLRGMQDSDVRRRLTELRKAMSA